MGKPWTTIGKSALNGVLKVKINCSNGGFLLPYLRLPEGMTFSFEPCRPATPALVSEPGHGRGCRQSRRCPCQRSPCPEAELETHPLEGNKHGYHMDIMEKMMEIHGK